MPVSFNVDVDLCTACQLCVVGCKDEHTTDARLPWTEAQPVIGQFWMRVQTLEAGLAPRVEVAHLPVLCQHCADAPCIKACPENAIKRRADGLVWIDPEVCDGCRLCEAACPYDVIYFNATLGIAQKCTGCAHRVDEGLLPRCVEMCPHGALAFSLAEDLPGDAFLPEHRTRPLVRWRGLPDASIAGRVVDEAAVEVVVDATVTVRDLATDLTHELVTDAFGEFRWRGDGAGHRFLVTIVRDGWAPSRHVVEATFGTDLGTVRLRTSPTDCDANERGAVM